MVAQLRHRGPDESGIWSDEAVTLGHTRLSIIDLSTGQQPMLSADGRYAITFNGEIFNYVELREELRRAGRTFRTNSDTEVLLEAFAHWGQACVERLNGQWAAAVWDRRQRRLVLSRDRFGIRPLYYAEVPEGLLFASEVKALMAHRGLPRELDPVGLDQLLTYWAPLPGRTVFRGIRELPPGCQLVIQADSAKPNDLPEPRRYWQLDYDPSRRDERRWKSVDDCAAELRHLLDDAARLRLRSDVPVGAYLSGGLDSSITTALIRRHNDRLRTFSVTFDDAEFDESPYQRELVDALRTDHTALRCHAADIAEAFPEVVRGAERPMLRSAPAPLWLLARLVRASDFKVVLTGEGADEVLAGYDIFKEAKVRRFCAMQPQSAWRGRLFERLYPYLPNLSRQSPAYLAKFFRVRPEELGNPFFSHLPRWEMTAGIKRLLSPEWRERLADDQPADERANRLGSADGADAELRRLLPDGFEGWSPLGQAQWLEATVLMPGYILSSQGDRMAMAHGVEGRFPFLDHRVAELAAAIPDRWRMRGLTEKYILRRAVADLLPKHIRRRTKQPYRAPDGASFFDPDTGRARAEWIERVLDPTHVADGGVFHPRAIAQLTRKARRGGLSGMRDNMALMAVLSTQLLVEQFLGESSDRRIPPTCGDCGAPLGSCRCRVGQPIVDPVDSIEITTPTT